MRHVIGIDAGGTATRAVLLDETGRCVGYGRAGAGNPTSAGAEVAIGNHVLATEKAIGRTGISPDLVMLTLAGGLGRDTGPLVATALADAGISTVVHVAGDVMSAYFSATANPTGYLVLSGTGAISAHIVDGELAGLADGIGWLLGDEGSGFRSATAWSVRPRPRSKGAAPRRPSPRSSWPPVDEEGDSGRGRTTP